MKRSEFRSAYCGIPHSVMVLQIRREHWLTQKPYSKAGDFCILHPDDYDIGIRLEPLKAKRGRTANYASASGNFFRLRPSYFSFVGYFLDTREVDGRYTVRISAPTNTAQESD